MRVRAVSLAFFAALATAPFDSAAQTAAPAQPARPERIVINPIVYGAYAGTAIPLSARVWMVGQADPAPEARVEWSSSNSAVAWVSDAGTLTFVKPGKVTVRARSGSVSTEQLLEVKDNPARSIEIGAISTDAKVGDTVRVQSKILGKGDAAVTDARINYAIVAPRGRGVAPRARISADGQFVAQDPGTYTIIAEIAGFADREQIRVRAPGGAEAVARKRVPGSDDEKVKFADIDYAPYVGTSFPIAPMIHRKGSEPVLNTNVSWALDNNDVAAISHDGVITFLKPGKVTVTADDGVFQLTKKFAVQSNPSAKMVMVVNLGDVRVGDSVKVNVQIWARGGLPVKDARPNFAILSEGQRTQKATITEDGMFVAEEPGVYTIIAEIGGLADKTTIAVRPRDPGARR